MLDHFLYEITGQFSIQTTKMSASILNERKAPQTQPPGECLLIYCAIYAHHMRPDIHSPSLQESVLQCLSVGAQSCKIRERELEDVNKIFMMNRILIVGGTGYLGKYLAKASVSQGYPTFVLVRPAAEAALDSSKEKLLQELKDNGINILLGSSDDHNSLVDAIKQVDIVISALAIPQHLEQFNLIRAIKEVGNIKRFIPSEFGNEVDRVEALPPFQRVCDNKKKIRRAIEEAGIPYSFISANSFMAYFVDYFLHPRQKPQPEEVVIYGDGLTKEDDIAAFTIRVANDPRTMNKLVICKPPCNIISQSELVSLWEKKTGKTLKKVFFPETEMVRLSQTLPHPDNVRISVLHNIFVKGGQTNFELGYEDLEASELYEDHKYTTVDEFLDTCFISPPETKLTSF